MTLLIEAQEVESLLSIESCLEALEASFRELADGRAVNRPRTDTFTATSDPDVFYRYKSMEGLVPGCGVMALRINSERIRWPLVDGRRRQDKFQRVYPNRYVGIVLLFSIESGELLAIMKEAYLQKMRVGGTSGLGIKYLAREDAASLGLLGSGWQAGVQLTAACAVRKIDTVKVYSPNADSRKKFADDMGRQLDLPIVPVDRPQDAAEDVDILLAATSAMQPVLEGKWIKPGMHVGSINTRREIDADTLANSDYIVVNTRDTGYAVYIAGSGEGVVPLKEKELDVRACPEIGEVISGKAKGRSSAREKTLFLCNIGLGTQFAAVAARVYQAALDKDVGRRLPPEWFLETVKK